MITLVWAKSSKPLSKAIRWATGEDCSHFAICLDRRIIFHSDLRGVHIAWFEDFSKTHDVVHSYQIPNLSLEQEESVYQAMIARTGRMYDFLGLLYFGYRLVLLRFLGKPLPSVNKWGSAHLDMCIEEASVLDPIIPALPNISMTTPHNMYLYFEKLKGESK
jgi:hypothetical protein